MTELETALLILQATAPDKVAAFWALTYATVGGAWLVLGITLLRPGPEPRRVAAHSARTVRRAPRTARPASGPRHAGIGTTQWQPMHTRKAVQRRGRHHAGERRIVGSLLDTRADLTLGDLEYAR